MMNNPTKEADTVYAFPDPFAPRPRHFGASFVNALLATALFRCWHILIFYGAWSATVGVINVYGTHFTIQPTLLTVIGTVIGFVISYRTTSSFERYNEGRRLWSQIILSSRTLARLVWFHIPEIMQISPEDTNLTEAEKRARVIVEKKTVINLIEAFSVAVKHYLRGEDGIFYTDLYYLVKHLPAYALPTSLPSATNLSDEHGQMSPVISASAALPPIDHGLAHRHLRQNGSLSLRPSAAASAPHLPLPVTTTLPTRPSFLEPPPTAPSQRMHKYRDHKASKGTVDSEILMPARSPPKYHLFDLFPFSLLVRLLTKRGAEVKGKKAARMRAKLRGASVSHNLPLEISLYLSSYIAAIQSRKVIDPPTGTNLLATLNALVDALTGLERILTTPIPFSYSIHLWVVTIIYCLALPVQLWASFKWLTVPATVVASFIFFGFLVAGEEIENPFGYDKNDLNMDHFTHNIIRNELRALTATPAPMPAVWAFSPENDLVFAAKSAETEDRITPNEWLAKGLDKIHLALSNVAPTTYDE